jgi:exodeoxyribonuclease VII large subunit
VRAATPSHAAEIITPDCEEWLARIREAKKKLSVERYFSERRQQIDRFWERLHSAWDRNSQPRGRSIAALAARLDALSPLKVLARGYAVAQNAGGVPIRSVNDVTAGDILDVRLSDGWIKAKTI